MATKTKKTTKKEKPAGPKPQVVSAASDILKRAELAFEEAFPRGELKTLWRLSSLRGFKGREIRHVNWFATEEAAKAHAAWIAEGRGRVVSLAKFHSEESVGEMLRRANDVLRTASEIAKRDGEKTNWASFRAALHNILAEQHRVMYPQQYESR